MISSVFIYLNLQVKQLSRVYLAYLNQVYEQQIDLDISSLHIETMRFTHEARISKIFKGGGVVNQRIKVINIMICILYFFIVCIGFIG